MALTQKGAAAGLAALVRITAGYINFRPAAAAAAVIGTAFYITIESGHIFHHLSLSLMETFSKFTM